MGNKNGRRKKKKKKKRNTKAKQKYRLSSTNGSGFVACKTLCARALKLFPFCKANPRSFCCHSFCRDWAKSPIANDVLRLPLVKQEQMARERKNKWISNRPPRFANNGTNAILPCHRTTGVLPSAKEACYAIRHHTCIIVIMSTPFGGQ